MWLRADDLHYRKGGPPMLVSLNSDQFSNTGAAANSSPIDGGSAGSNSGRHVCGDELDPEIMQTLSVEKPSSKATHKGFRDSCTGITASVSTSGIGRHRRKRLRQLRMRIWRSLLFPQIPPLI